MLFLSTPAPAHSTQNINQPNLATVPRPRTKQNTTSSPHGMGKGKNSASSGGSRSNGSAAGAASSASGNNTTTSTPATPVRDAEQSSANDDNPQTPTKRSSTKPSPPPYEATATQLEVYNGKQRAGRDCPRCVWPLILNSHNDPRKHPRPACPRWQFDDCAFLGLQIHFGGKFCWVCGVKFVEGDIVWVYGEPSSFIFIFCVPGSAWASVPGSSWVLFGCCFDIA